MSEILLILIVTTGFVVSNALWLKYVKFTINSAVSRNPLELAQRTQISEEKRPEPKKQERKPRPEGL